MAKVPKELVVEALVKSRKQWNYGAAVIGFFRNRVKEARKTHGLDTTETAKLLSKAARLAKEASKDFGTALRILNAKPKKETPKTAELRRVGGAFGSLWEFFKKPFKFLGAAGALNGFEMYLGLITKSVVLYEKGFRSDLRLVKMSGHDPDQRAYKILSDAQKKMREVAGLLRTAQRTIKSIKIEQT